MPVLSSPRLRIQLEENFNYLRLRKSLLQLGHQIMFSEHKEHLIKLERNIFSKICNQATGEQFNRTILQGMNLTFDLCKEGQQICFHSAYLIINLLSGQIHF